VNINTLLWFTYQTIQTMPHTAELNGHKVIAGDLLSPLGDDRMNWLLERATQRTKNKGEHIYYTNEPSGHVFIIESGKVKVGGFSSDGRESIRRLANPGDLIGELALTGEQTRKEHAVALEDETVVYQVDLQDIYTLMRSKPEFAIHFVRHLTQQLKLAQRRCEGIVFNDARTRIVEAIRSLAQTQGQVLAGGSVLITHALTHQDLALYTATSRQTVTTVLNELKDNNIINFDRKSILVHELETLR
jgi:CRP/FNR family transcriptional regulator, cyclic AMP receptor protein